MSTTFDPNAAAAGDGIFGLPHGVDDAAVHVLSVPFEATTSYRRGTANGPGAVLAASRQIDLHDVLTGNPHEAGIFAVPTDTRIDELNREASELALPIIACGGQLGGDAALTRGLERVNQIGASVNEIVAAQTAAALDAGKLACLVGGDHSIPFGAIAAAAERHPGLGVLHFDAHADLRVAYEGFTWSHASIFHNVLQRISAVSHLVQVGIRDLCEAERHVIRSSEDRITTLFDDDWSLAHSDGVNQRELVRNALARLPDEVWVSFDIDGLDPSLCPNTGTPVPGGLAWGDVTLWLRELMASNKRIVGLDVCEVSPGATPDSEGEGWDAIVGARLLYRLIGAALATR